VLAREDFVTPDKPMTKTEREELKRLARERARVAKHDAQRRTADLKAVFEQELLTHYDYNRDEVWKEAVEAATKAGEEAAAKIAQRCEELGIPAAFAPRLSVMWQSQGPAAVQYEQADIRRAAYKRIEAQERAALAEIDRAALEIQTNLVRAGLTSIAAIEFLSAMPSVAELMPVVDIDDLERKPRRSLGMGDDDLGF
jgi:aryl carrier-like protein